MANQPRGGALSSGVWWNYQRPFTATSCGGRSALDHVPRSQPRVQRLKNETIQRFFAFN